MRCDTPNAERRTPNAKALGASKLSAIGYGLWAGDYHAE
jgi:hypothetical protein